MRKCLDCTSEPTPGRVRCEKCAGVNRDRNRLMYAERKAAGLCYTCGKPSLPDRTRCERCLKYYANYIASYSGGTARPKLQTAEPTPIVVSKVFSDEALLANGRCGTCRMLNPCGGHRKAQWYAEHREHAE